MASRSGFRIDVGFQDRGRVSGRGSGSIFGVEVRFCIVAGFWDRESSYEVGIRFQDWGQCRVTGQGLWSVFKVRFEFWDGGQGRVSGPQNNPDPNLGPIMKPDLDIETQLLPPSGSPTPTPTPKLDPHPETRS